MDIQLTEQRLLALGERLPAEEIRQRAMDRRTTAFAGGIGGFLQRPKAEDVSLVASQRRVEPFWHVSCRARYVYDRSRDYAIPASAADVRSVTVGGVDYPVGATPKGDGFVISVLEHCRDEPFDELFVDGLTGTALTDGAALIGGASTEVADPGALAAGDTVVVAPEHRASSVVRQLLAKMMRPLQADTVSEEALTLERIDLYYRPVFAFEFLWGPKDRRSVIEIDGLTGQTRNAASLRTQLGRAISRDALFDIGADTIGLLVPGGSIAVKVARVALDKSY